MKKKTAKEVKMHKFLAFACKSQDFAQSQKNFAPSHDGVTVSFRNSVWVWVCWLVCTSKCGGGGVFVGLCLCLALSAYLSASEAKCV